MNPVGSIAAGATQSNPVGSALAANPVLTLLALLICSPFCSSAGAGPNLALKSAQSSVSFVGSATYELALTPDSGCYINFTLAPGQEYVVWLTLDQTQGGDPALVYWADCATCGGTYLRQPCMSDGTCPESSLITNRFVVNTSSGRARLASNAAERYLRNEDPARTHFIYFTVIKLELS